MEKTNSVYIHIPFCVSKCRYCDFFSIPCGKKEKCIPDEYIEALCNQIKSIKNKTVSTVYVGGGTPSLLQPDQIKKLFDSLFAFCNIEKNAEITFEVNPDDVSEELLQVLESNGVNRISCGIQSMNNKALEFAGRRADVIANKKALELLKKYWNYALSIDLICGLPFETEQSFEAGLKQIISYSPEHISMYSLTLEDETPFGKYFSESDNEYDYDFADTIWLKGRELLGKNGYSQYEVSNFAKSDDASFMCRHNLAYWNHMDYEGIGSGAAGTVYEKDGSGVRYTNNSDIQQYINYWVNHTGINPQMSEKIDLETSEFEFFMMGLRKNSGISASEFEQIFAKKFPEKFIKVFNKWQEKGLCEIKEDRYFLNSKGLLFLNSFLLELQ